MFGRHVVPGPFALECADNCVKVGRGQNFHSRQKAGLDGVFGCDNESLCAVPSGRPAERENSIARTEGAVQPQFSKSGSLIESVEGYHPFHREDAKRDSEVEARPGLGNRPRRQVDRDAFEWPGQTGREECRPHPVAGLPDTNVWKPDHVERGETLRKVGFDFDGMSVDSQKCC